MKNNKNTEKPYKTKLDEFIGETFQKVYDKIGIAVSIFFGLIILIVSIISFIRLISNNYFSWFNFDLSDKNEVGDALGGLTAPFIGITGVILTFLAFWVQYKFNQKQSQFYKNDKWDKKIDEFSSLLEIVCNRDKTTTNNMVLILSRTTTHFINKYRDDELKVSGDIITMIKNGFIYFYKIHNPSINKISEDEINDKVQTTLNVYRDFESFIDLCLIDFKNFNLSESEQVDLIGKFHNKFKLIYDAYEDNLCFFLLYYISLNKKNTRLTEFLDIVSTTKSDKIYLKSLASEINYLN